MRGTRAWVAGAGLFGLALALFGAGCAGVYPSGSMRFAYGPTVRPHPDYFCADCHGVAYFDPYYDLCLSYGYAFDWRGRPDVVSSYRQSYVRIRRAYPDAGRYRYPTRYREVTHAKFAGAGGRLPVYRGKAAPPAGPKGSGPTRKNPEEGGKREKKKGGGGTTDEPGARRVS